MEEIDLKELFEFFKGKIGLFIIIIAGVCLLGSIYGLFIQKPIYKSYTTVILSGKENTSSGITQNDILLNKNLVDNYAEIVKSRRVLDKVIKKLDLKMTYEQLVSKINVTALNNTEIIKITVVDENAKQAKNIANITADYFTDEVSELYNMDNVNILDEAIESKRPYNINIIRQSIMYLGAGLVISLGILFLIFYFDRTIKSVEQIEQKIKLPILGSVQQYGRGGKK